MARMVSRQGRQLQRYSEKGSRLVVGCIPYKFKTAAATNVNGDPDQLMEVLVISSSKGNGLLFPKGGWESDETITEAVSREAFEEAGIQGIVERKLGTWKYKSRKHDAYNEGIMFPMSVTQQLEQWPEMHFRDRRWVTVAEAKEGCQRPWMVEALERLVIRLSISCRKDTTSTSKVLIDQIG